MDPSEAPLTSRHECSDAACERCRTAVTRAYEGLKLVGQDDRSAFRAAVMVLSLRSPGHARNTYERLVSGWLGHEAGRPVPNDRIS